MFRFVINSLTLMTMTSFVMAQFDVQEIERTDEKELKVKLEYAAGKLSIQKITSDKLCRVSINRNDGEMTPSVAYEKNGSTGFLNLQVDENHSIGMFDVGKQDVKMQITEKIPVSFNIDMGACEGNLDFTNLRVRDLTMNLGASSSDIYFNAQNRDRINKIRIEAGVSRLNFTGLCNANFDKLEFEGGVGNYVLDFSGNLSQSARANISVGIGKVLIRIPKNLAVKIHTDDSFLSSIRISDSDFEKRRDGVYVSRGYDEADARLEMWVEAGLGKLRVEVTE